MATVKIDTFGGIAPRQHPTQLADGMAVTAHNCRLKTGKLVPLRMPLEVQGANILLEDRLADIADAQSIHVWRRFSGDFDFLLYKGVTWSAPGNIAADDLTRIVISGDRDGDGTVDEPVVYFRDADRFGAKVVYPIVKHPIGYDAMSYPDGKPPIVSRFESGNIPEGSIIRYTRFFLTWVDKYGMESPVSPPSVNLVGENPLATEADDLQYVDGDRIKVRIPDVADLDERYVALRVYKVVAGAEEGHIQFVYEISKEGIDALRQLSPPADSFSFRVKDEDAGEIMPEIEAPPADLSCIHDVPGAFYCGFSPSMPKTVCFSDIDLLYSWPVAYRYDVADNLVALAVTSNSVFALTEGWPYVLSGTAPESMSVAKLAGPAACVSPRGVCVYRNAVYFVSNQGLMAIFNSADAGTVCQNLTDKIFTKDQWLALNPSSCVMGQHDGALFLYFTLADGTHKGLTIDLMDDMKIAVTTHDEAATCLCVDVKEDKMYFVRERRS